LPQVVDRVDDACDVLPYAQDSPIEYTAIPPDRR